MSFMNSSFLPCILAWGMQKMEERPNLLISALRMEVVYLTMGERTKQATADNDSEHSVNGARPAEGVNGIAGTHFLPKEGPMQPKAPRKNNLTKLADA